MSEKNPNSEIYSAICKAQAEMPVVPKNQSTTKSGNKSYSYKYADIADIVKLCSPILAKHNLAIIHKLESNDLGTSLVTLLLHSSGQSISSVVKIEPEYHTMQSLGAAITYLRRYSYAAIIGLALGDDDDDAKKIEEKETKSYAVFITREQLDQLNEELADHPDIKDSILLKMNIASLGSIPKDKFSGVLKRIREIKQHKVN